MSPASPPPPPPAPLPTPALPPHQLQNAMQYQIPLSSAPAVGPGGLILPSNAAAAASSGKADDSTGRRDSKSNLAPLLPAVGNLRNTRHLSSSLTSLNSTVASSMISNTSFPPQSKAPLIGAAAIPGQLSKPQVAPMTDVSSAMTASFSGPLPSATSTPNPPRSLALSSVVGDGVGRSLGGGMGSGLRRQSASGSVRLPLNTRAAARVVARLDLRQLASVGRYNECSNTVMLEVSGSSSREIGELGVAMSGPMPSTGDWALYFRGAKQLEHFLAALSVEAVVCERELCESNVQQFLLEGAQASAGGWAAVTTYAGGA